MRILVVCGAGASSTFVAQRVRGAAARGGIECDAHAGSERTLADGGGDLDIVLIGPHLEPRFDDIRAGAAARGARAVLLPADIYTDLDGTRTLALVQDALLDGEEHHG